MELQPLFQRVIGLDIHQAQVTACAILTEPDGHVTIERRQFGAFQRDRRALAQWCASHRPDRVVMESTGIYWKSPYAALEKVGIQALIQGDAPQAVLRLASRRLKAGQEEILDALQGGLTASHRFVLKETLNHIESLEARIARFDAQLLEGLEPQKNALELLQTLPGIDVVGAALLLCSGLIISH